MSEHRSVDKLVILGLGLIGGSLAAALRCRVRYFSDGVAIGSRGFIEELFQAQRACFGAKRKDGARPIREAETGLFSLRALRVHAVE